MQHFVFLAALAIGAYGSAEPKAEVPLEAVRGDARKPADRAEANYWLRNMLVYHRFTIDEVIAATGLCDERIRRLQRECNLYPIAKPRQRPDAALLTLPYPGGRHPRIGFREGAVRPQRETKFSVFAPWDESAFVVADVPEAIWSNLGLTYLAHEHIPTIWDEQSVELQKLEWTRHADGRLSIERELPNRIAFGVEVIPHARAIAPNFPAIQR